MSLKKKFLFLSGLSVLAAAPAFASTFFRNSPGQIFTSMDFSAASTVAGHQNWGFWTPTTSGSAGTRFVDVGLDAKPSGVGQCYEIRVDGGPGAANPDIQLYTADSRSIDDDGPNGSRTPLARLWITGSGALEYNLRFSAYSTASNNVDFGIRNDLITATTSAQCDNGVYPFYNQSTNTILRANSLAN